MHESKVIKIVDGDNSINQATVAGLPNANPLHVALVDASGTQITDFGSTGATGYEGSPVTISLTAIELTFSGVTKIINVQSDHDNTGKIWLGKSNIDNTGANACGRLAPGQSVEITLNDATEPVYAVSDTADQKIYKWAII